MKERQARVDSASWTGELPPVARRKPATAFQLALMLALTVYAVPRSVWALYDGFAERRILVPLNKWDHAIPLSNPILFTLCVAGWVLVLAVAALMGTASIVLLNRRLGHSLRRRFVALFGRKKPAEEKSNPGHEAVLRLLDEKEEQGDETSRLQVAGRSLFETVYRMLAKPERGARIEDMLGLLGATGGFACIVAALHVAKETSSLKENDFLVANGVDGRKYYFGDLPNRYLMESRLSLFDLTLGQAKAAGANVSWDSVSEVQRHTASAVGLPEFGSPELPQKHRPSDSFDNYVTHLWPTVSKVLDLYKVKPERRPSAIGFAIQTAIDRAKAVLDPATAAQIVIEYAVPAAKRDPAEFEGHWPKAKEA